MILFRPNWRILVVILAIWSTAERIPARGFDSLAFTLPLLLFSPAQMRF